MSRNPFMERMERTSNLTKSHKRAPKQENELVKRLKGARLVPRSGAGHDKGDVRIKGVARIECKTTKHKSFSVTAEMIDKIEEEAALAGELPIIVIEMIDEHGRKLREIAVCPTYVLDSLVSGD